MAGIERRRHRRTQIDIAQPQNEIAGGKDHLLHRLDRIEPVDAADEFDVGRAPGRIRPHQLLIPRHRQPRLLIIPRQGQMNDAARHPHMRDIRERRFDLLQRRHQIAERQHIPVVMDLQGADAGNEVDDAGKTLRPQPLHDELRPQPQRDVQHQGAELDQQITVPGEAIADGAVALPHAPQHRPLYTRERQAPEAHPVTGPQLAELPQLVPHDHGRADEAAEARAIRTKDDRHVAGEIDGADGIGVVVDVGGMQPGLATIRPRPARLRPDQPDTGPRRVVVNLVSRAEEIGDVRILEEVRRAMGPVQYADLPIMRQHRRRDRLAGPDGRRPDAQRVARAQTTDGVAAELPEREGRPRTEIQRRVKATLDGEVGPIARPLHTADGEHLTRLPRRGR